MVGLTNVNPATTSPGYKCYTVCAQFGQALAAGRTATVVCADNHTDKYRYVFVQSAQTTALRGLCLAELNAYSCVALSLHCVSLSFAENKVSNYSLRTKSEIN